MKHKITFLLVVIASAIAMPSASAQLTRFVRAYASGHPNATDPTMTTNNQAPEGPQGASNPAFGGRATASANYGYARVYAYLPYPGVSQLARYWAQSVGAFRDVVTINHPTLNGTTGFITVTYRVDVSVSSSGQTEPGFQNSATFNSRAEVNNVTEVANVIVHPSGAVFYGGSGNIFNQPRTITASFTFGEPFYVLLQIQAAAFGYHHYQSNNLVDAEHTTTWGGINAVTVDGSPVSDYTVVAQSGADYAQPIVPPQPVVASRHMHSGTPYDILLPLTGTLGIEPRSGGANGSHQVTLTFDSPVTYTGASVTSGAGTVANTSGTGTNAVTIDLTGVTNAQTITLALTGVNTGIPIGDIVVRMGVLLGDTNGSGTVSASDIGQLKSQSGQPVGSANFRTDLNANGTVNATDVSIIKSVSGMSLP